METPVFAMSGPNTGPSASFVRYAPLANGAAVATWVSSTTQARTRFARAGTARNLYVRLPNAPNTGKSYTFNVMKNDVATTLEVAISDAATTGSDVDIGHAITIAEGDDLCIRCTPSGTPDAIANVQIGFVFESTDAGKSVLFSSHATTAAALYMKVGSSNAAGVTEPAARNYLPVGGVIDRMYVRRHTAPTAGNSVTYTLQVDGVDTALSATISDANLTASDTAAAVSVSAGQYISINVTISGTPATAVGTVGLDWSPTTDGEALMLAGGGTVSSVADNYGNAMGNGNATATEAAFYAVAPMALTLRKLRADVTTDPGSGKSRAFTVRKGGVSQALTCTIADTNVTASDTSNTVSVSAGDLLNFLTVPTNTPTAPGAFAMSMVAYTGAAAPSGGGGNLLLLGVG